MENDNMLPPTSRNGWKYIFVAFALLGITGVVLSVLYRDSTKPGEVIEKARRKAATQVVYTIVFSAVGASEAERITEEIIADIGADSMKTDLIIGSPVTDPWCANIGEYRRNLRKAMTEMKSIPVGKQSVVVSMVAGLLTKNELPARIYLVGRLAEDDISSIVPRTEKTAAAVELRSSLMGAVTVISYLSPKDAKGNADYERIFASKQITFTSR